MSQQNLDFVKLGVDSDWSFKKMSQQNLIFANLGVDSDLGL